MAAEVISDLSAADMIDYRKRALDVLRANLNVSNWGVPYTLERNSGKNVQAYRPAIGAALPTTPLTEATNPSDTPMTTTLFSATLAQYGEANTFSDFLQAVAPGDFMEQMHQLFAIRSRDTLETLNLTELYSGAPAFYAAGFDSGSFDNTAIASSKDIRRLKKYFGTKKVPGMPEDGMYRLAIHPDINFDITSDDVVGSVTDLQKRDSGDAKWKGFVKTYSGFYVYENQLISTTSLNGTTPYRNVACGYGSFAAYDLKGMPLKFYLVDPENVNVSNMLGLKGAVGWKIAYAADYIGSDGARALIYTALSSEPTA